MTDLATHIEDHGTRWQLTLRMNGEPVSGVGIVKSRIRIGKASVRMAGIAGLWTAPEHRLKGYGSRSMWEAIRPWDTCLAPEHRTNPNPHAAGRSLRGILRSVRQRATRLIPEQRRIDGTHRTPDTALPQAVADPLRTGRRGRSDATASTPIVHRHRSCLCGGRRRPCVADPGLALSASDRGPDARAPAESARVRLPVCFRHRSRCGRRRPVCRLRSAASLASATSPTVASSRRLHKPSRCPCPDRRRTCGSRIRRIRSL